MNKADFDTVAQVVHQRSGLVLTGDKAYLVESRLAPVMRRHKCRSLEDLAQRLRAGPAAAIAALAADVTEAMTTNETSFFRDIKPFELFEKQVVPALRLAVGQGRPLRIWSAACSSGQEPYTLAMILDQMSASTGPIRAEIIATDISRDILARAEQGLYSQFEVQRGLPITSVVKYFTPVGDKWQLAERIRRMVTFRPFNLLDDFGTLGRFDVVFCRNVLIYFDVATKTRVLDRLAASTHPHGYLFLGGAETILGLTDQWRMVDGARGLYAPGATPVTATARPAAAVAVAPPPAQSLREKAQPQPQAQTQRPRALA